MSKLVTNVVKRAYIFAPLVRQDGSPTNETKTVYAESEVAARMQLPKLPEGMTWELLNSSTDETP